MGVCYFSGDFLHSHGSCLFPNNAYPGRASPLPVMVHQFFVSDKKGRAFFITTGN
jgi:hypothetical protein